MDLRENEPLTPMRSGCSITHITMNVTRKCNLGCQYCFSKCYTEYDEVDMSLETAKKTVDWLMYPSTSGDAKKLDISFWGGEPLLRWDLIKQITPYATLRAAEVGKTITFGGTTNVTLLTEDKFDFMDKYNIRFLLSIDGIKKHHDMFRTYKDGTGSWDSIQKRIEPILKRWPQSQVRLSFTEENVHELIDDLNYFYETGFRNIVYSPVSEGEWAQDKLDILDKVWDDVADWFVMHPDVHMKFVEDACAHNLGRTFQGPPCGAARHYVGIDYDGSIWPCHRFCKFDNPLPWYEQSVCLGHIDYGILNQSWRERFVNWTADDINNDCTNCSAHKISCSGGCWATNYDIMGDIGTVPPMNCHLSRTSLKQGKKVIKLLGPQKAFKFKTNTGFGQEGCTCFNVRDKIHGKIEIDLDNPNVCLCDIAHYGLRSDYSTCPCYNSADDNRGIFDKRSLPQQKKRQDLCRSDCQK